MNRAGVFVVSLLVALIAAWFHLPWTLFCALLLMAFALVAVIGKMHQDQSEAVAALTSTPVDEDEVGTELIVWWPWWRRQNPWWSLRKQWRRR